MTRKRKRKIDERSSGRDDHGTPAWLIKLIVAYRAIGLDPAGGRGTPASRAAKTAWYGYNAKTGRGIDGLRNPWRGYGLVFTNPPYGRIVRAWAQKAIDAFSPTYGVEFHAHLSSRREGAVKERDELMMLVAARVNSGWFRLLARHAAAVLYFNKRLQFIGEVDDAKFPSAMLYFGTHAKRFASHFGDLGTVVYSEGFYTPEYQERRVFMRFPTRLPKRAIAECQRRMRPARRPRSAHVATRRA